MQNRFLTHMWTRGVILFTDGFYLFIPSSSLPLLSLVSASLSVSLLVGVELPFLSLIFSLSLKVTALSRLLSRSLLFSHALWSLSSLFWCRNRGVWCLGRFDDGRLADKNKGFTSLRSSSFFHDEALIDSGQICLGFLFFTTNR